MPESGFKKLRPSGGASGFSRMRRNSDEETCEPGQTRNPETGECEGRSLLQRVEDAGGPPSERARVRQTQREAQPRRQGGLPIPGGGRDVREPQAGPEGFRQRPEGEVIEEFEDGSMVIAQPNDETVTYCQPGALCDDGESVQREVTAGMDRPGAPGVIPDESLQQIRARDALPSGPELRAPEDERGLREAGVSEEQLRIRADRGVGQDLPDPNFTKMEEALMQARTVAGSAVESLGDLSIVGKLPEAAGKELFDLAQRAGNLLRAWREGAPVETELRDFGAELQALQERYPKSGAIGQVVGSLAGIGMDILGTMKIAGGLATSLPAGSRARGAAEALSRFNQPTSARGAAVEVSREVPVQASLALRGEGDKEMTAFDVGLAAALGAAFPGGRRGIEAIEEGFSGLRLKRNREMEQLTKEQLGIDEIHFSIRNEDGDEVGSIIGRQEGDAFFIDWMEAGGPGAIGNEGVVDIGAQILNRYPEAQRISGEHVTGTRGAANAGEASRLTGDNTSEFFTERGRESIARLANRFGERAAQQADETLDIAGPAIRSEELGAAPPEVVARLGLGAAGGAAGAAVGAELSPEGGELLGAGVGAVAGALGGASVGRRLSNVSAEQLREGTKRILGGEVTGEDVSRFLRREFRSAGDVPEEMFNAYIEANAWFKKQANKVRQIDTELTRTLRDLSERGAIESPEVGNEMVNTALRRMGTVNNPEAILRELPPELRDLTTRMRSEIDAMTQRLKDDGIVQGDLVATLDANQGIYLNRAYRRWTDPEWVFDKIDPAIVNRARNYLKAQEAYFDWSDEQLDNLMRHWLYDQDGVAQTALRGNIDSKDLDVLRKRFMDARPIRELYGEFQTARDNFARSVLRGSQIIATHNWLSEVKRIGMETGRISDNRADAFARGHIAQLAGEGTDTLSPLNGLWADPELDRALRELRSVDEIPYPSWLLKAVGATKLGKTVFSIQTHVRNFISASMFSGANGHLFDRDLWSNLRTARRGVASDIGREGVAFRREARGVPSRELENETVIDMAVDGQLDLTDTGAMQALMNRMTELGVTFDAARAGELRDIVQDMLKTDTPEELAEKIATRGGASLRKVGDAAQTLYRAEDDFWKILGMLSEYKAYRNALPGVPAAEVQRMAARNIRNTYPTYSLVPKAARRIRQSPWIGPFTAFTSEIIRTGYNTMSLAAQEMRSSNEAIRAIGRRRAAGIATAATATGAMAWGVNRFMTGISEETDRDFREGLPPWSRNGDIMWLNYDRDNGTINYIDLSYSDPYNWFKRPIIRLLTDPHNDTWQEEFKDVIGELGDPFFSRDIFTGAFSRIAFNQDARGQRIYNTQATAGRQAQQIGSFLLDELQPGALSQARRVAEGFGWIKNEDGSAMAGGRELLATFGGTRISQLDFNDMVFFRGREMMDRLDEARALIAPAYRNTSDEGDVEQAFTETNEARRRILGEYQRVVHTAKVAGLSENQIRIKMKEAGITDKIQDELITGRYTPYIPQDVGDRGRQFQLEGLQRRDTERLDPIQPHGETPGRGSGIEGGQPEQTPTSGFRGMR